jgi:hypothetical protein
VRQRRIARRQEPLRERETEHERDDRERHDAADRVEQAAPAQRTGLGCLRDRRRHRDDQHDRTGHLVREVRGDHTDDGEADAQQRAPLERAQHEP